MSKSGNRYGPQFVIEAILTRYIENSALHMEIVMSEQRSEWVFHSHYHLCINAFTGFFNYSFTMFKIRFLRF